MSAYYRQGSLSMNPWFEESGRGEYLRGPHRYLEFLEMLSDPDQERLEEFEEWAGMTYDPNTLKPRNWPQTSLPRKNRVPKAHCKAKQYVVFGEWSRSFKRDNWH